MIIASPQNIVAEPGKGIITLKWDAVDGATSYKVLKATESNTTNDTGYTEAGTNVTDLSYVLSGLNPGQSYYFKVKATLNSTDSLSSTEATAVVKVVDPGTIFNGNKILVNNQSTDIVSSQSTGTLSVNEDTPNMNVMDSGELDPEAYRINPEIPFEPVEGQEPVNFNMEGELQTQETYTLNGTKNFTTQNTKDSSYYTTTARCAYVGTHVVVWVDNDNSATVKLSNDQAKLIGEEFDAKIYNLVAQNFYTESDVNNDSKVAILCFDIKDSYNGVGTGYVGGYFWGGDLYSKTVAPTVANSNEMEVFYADTYPTMGTTPTSPDVSGVYSTLAHEFQHMVNFNCNVLVEKNKYGMDSWLNEALSMAAEDLYSGTQTNRINYYNTSNAVINGRSLLDWKSNDEVLANYSLSYLFSQYLRTQVDQGLTSGSVKTGTAKIFNEIITDTKINKLTQDDDYLTVEKLIKARVDSKLSFGQFMTNFRAAMLVKAPKGPYGFNDETGFDTISTPLYTGGAIELKGGGAVVKSITAPFTLGVHGGDITYLGIYN